jgi:hypothetical protein
MPGKLCDCTNLRDGDGFGWPCSLVRPLAEQSQPAILLGSKLPMPSHLAVLIENPKYPACQHCQQRQHCQHDPKSWPGAPVKGGHGTVCVNATNRKLGYDLELFGVVLAPETELQIVEPSFEYLVAV